MRFTARLSISILFAAVVGLSSCGSDDSTTAPTDRAVDAAGDVTTDDGTGSSRVDVDDDTITMSTGEIPADWPDDVPLPDGFVVTAGSSVDGGASGRLVTVNGTTTLPLAELDAFFADALTGWTEATRMSSSADGADLLNVTYQLGERLLAVGGSARDGVTEVGLSYTYVPNADSSSAADPSVSSVGAIGVGDLGIDGVEEAFDAIGVEGVAGAMVSALDAERYEIVDETLHVHLGSSTMSPMIACIVATSTVEDLPIIMHDASGEQTECGRD